MRHLTAAQRGKDGGWHYVSMSSRGGHPLGYCAEHEPHPTEAEARECYTAYQRDNVEPNGRWSWGCCDVEGCDNPARDGWHVSDDGYSLAVLCSEHNNRDQAIIALGLNRPAGDAWQS